MTQVTLSPEDHARLVELYRIAQTTPVLYFAPGRDTASSAWEEVRRFMDELGKRYGYDPRKAQISMDSPTFEVDG